MKRYFLIIFTQNKPGVLNRISDLFLRRKINIESLTVSYLFDKEMSRFTIEVIGDKNLIEKITKQIYRIIEVYKVIESDEQSSFNKELLLVKIYSYNPLIRKRIEEQLKIFNGKIIFVGKKELVIEKIGSNEEIETFFSEIKNFGVIDYTRSGVLALKKETVEEKKFTFKKSSAFFTSLINESVIRSVQRYASRKKDVISFAQGIPVFPTPLVIKKELIDFMNKNLTDYYTTGYGIEELRKEIVKKLFFYNQIRSEKDEIIVTHGATQAMMAISLALFEKDDEVVIITPDYASHFSQLIIAQKGIYLKEVAMKEKDGRWILDIEELEKAISQKTKAIFFTNPNNPTGKVFTKEELEKILLLARNYNLYVISDEIYEYFTFDNKKHISIASLPKAKERVISIFGLSKSYSMTGWRIGYIYANQELIKEIYKVHDHLIVCPTAISQYAGLIALRQGKKIPEEFRLEYEKRRNLVINLLKKANNLTFTSPEGSYYIFPKINKKEVDNYSLVYKLIDQAKVAVVPGSVFGKGGENHFRVSFAKDERLLIEGLNRLINFFNNL